MIKWMKRGAPKGNLACAFVVSRISKIKGAQDGILAQLGKTFEAAYTVRTVQYGTDQHKAIRDKVRKAVDFGALEKHLVSNGTPEPVAKARIEAIINSINLNAGVNEICRSYCDKAAGVPDDFWGNEEGGVQEDTSALEEKALAL